MNFVRAVPHCVHLWASGCVIPSVDRVSFHFVSSLRVEGLQVIMGRRIGPLADLRGAPSPLRTAEALAEARYPHVRADSRS